MSSATGRTFNGYGVACVPLLPCVLFLGIKLAFFADDTDTDVRVGYALAAACAFLTLLALFVVSVIRAGDSPALDALAVHLCPCFITPAAEHAFKQAQGALIPQYEPLPAPTVSSGAI